MEWHYSLGFGPIPGVSAPADDDAGPAAPQVSN